MTLQHTNPTTQVQQELTILATKRSKKRKQPEGPFTPESPLENNKTTLSDKSSCSKSSSPPTKSSKMFAPDSTTKGKDYRGFWSESKKELSMKLWLPTKTDLRVLVQKSSNGFLYKQAPLSSFSTKRLSIHNKSLLKTLCPSSTCSLVGLTEKERIVVEKKEYKKIQKLPKEQQEEAKKKLKDERKEKPKVRRCRLIRLKLTSEQLKILRVWFKDARKTYNLGLEFVLDSHLHRTPAPWSFVPTLGHGSHQIKDLQALLMRKFVGARGRKGYPKRELMSRTPKVPRQQAIMRLCDSLKTFQTNVKRRLELRAKYPNARTFKKDYRMNPTYKASKRVTHDTLYFEAGNSVKWVSTHSFSMYPRSSAMGNVETLDEINPVMFTSQPSIHYKLGRFYLMVTELVDVAHRARPDSAEVHSMCAIDPGVRKFATIYSPEGRVDILGTNTTKCLNKCIRRIDRSKKKISMWWKVFKWKKQNLVLSRKAKKKWRDRLRKARKTYRDTELKACNVVKNLHYNASHFICSQYKVILYPHFNAKEIAASKTLHRSVKRRLNMLSFYKFATRLKQTATWYDGRVIKRGSEAYTSKQCGKCGTLNEKLSGNEVFACGKCNLKIDRDVHGARNIFLRHLN